MGGDGGLSRRAAYSRCGGRGLFVSGRGGYWRVGGDLGMGPDCDSGARAAAWCKDSSVVRPQIFLSCAEYLACTVCRNILLPSSSSLSTPATKSRFRCCGGEVGGKGVIVGKDRDKYQIATKQNQHLTLKTHAQTRQKSNTADRAPPGALPGAW